ncbi:MAG TPA: NfeD family protein [Acidimicrobiia bacterium]|jgi:membrane protein implicated in regulation of membrane protease activity|nr:NfeD family protein [Acidimicrobiia bacterium]
MVDQAGIGRIVASCQRYWRDAGLSSGVIAVMASQLDEHLREAAAAGKPLDSVVGRDLKDFAEAWAAETVGQNPPRISTSARTSRGESRSQRELVLYGLGIVAVVVAVGVSRGETAVDNDIWRWLWTGLAVVMAIGEIFTAGFFLLPFAVGATAAAVLAWTGVGIVSQWLIFFGVSLVAFVYLRRFIARQDETSAPSVGANRWANTRGVVLTAIEPLESTGIVRIGGEEWRATADQPIPAGTQVVVLEVSGSRLVVMPLET